MIQQQNPGDGKRPSRQNKKWIAEEEQKLVTALKARTNLAAIAQTHSRTLGAIRSRCAIIVYRMHLQDIDAWEIADELSLHEEDIVRMITHREIQVAGWEANKALRQQKAEERKLQKTVYKMHSESIPMEEIIASTELSKEQITEVIRAGVSAKERKKSRAEQIASHPDMQQHRVDELAKQIAELQRQMDVLKQQITETKKAPEKLSNITPFHWLQAPTTEWL